MDLIKCPHCNGTGNCSRSRCRICAGLKLGESAEFAMEQDTQKSDLLRTKCPTIDIICCTGLYYVEPQLDYLS